MNRIVVLLIITFVLAGGVVAGYWNDWFSDTPSVRRTDRSKDVVKPLPEVDRNKVVSIELQDQQGKLKISRSGENWIIPDRFDAPVMKVRVKPLLDALAHMHAARHVASRLPAKYEVDDKQGRRLILRDDASKVLLDLVVGKQDRVRGGSPGATGTYVRRAGRMAIFRVRARLGYLLQSKPSWWLEKRLLSKVDRKKLMKMVKKAQKVVLEFDDINFAPQAGEKEIPESFQTSPKRVRVVLVKKKGKQKKPQPEMGPAPALPKSKKTDAEHPVHWEIVEPEKSRTLKVNTFIVESLVRSLLLGSMVDVVGRDPAASKFGLNNPVLELTANFEGGDSYNLKVGSKTEPPGDKKKNPLGTLRYAHMSGAPYVVTMNQYIVAQMAKKPLAFKMREPVAPKLPGQRKIPLPKASAASHPARKPGR